MKALAETMVERFAEHDVLTYASAIAFRLLVALVPLTAFALVLVGVSGHDELWVERAGPAVADRVPAATYAAVDATVSRVTGDPHLTWLALAGLVTLWDVSSSVRAVMGALNHAYGLDDERRMRVRFSLSLALGAAVLCLVLTALFLVAFGPSLFGVLPGPLEALARWVLVVACLWATITLLIRLAPAEHRAARWVTIGSLVVIAAWLAASVAFGFYARDFASFESPLGYVVAGLVLTSYLYTSAIVFLVGVEVDELLREASEGRPVRRGRRARRRRAPRRRSAGGAA